jgi:hypothetical protein
MFKIISKYNKYVWGAILDGAGVGKRPQIGGSFCRRCCRAKFGDRWWGCHELTKNYSAEKPRRVFWYFQVARIISGDPVKTPSPNEA